MDMAASGFSASILYRGYIDDPGNTDNAWREAEVWNFHYGLNDIFDEKIKEVSVSLSEAREPLMSDSLRHQNSRPCKAADLWCFLKVFFYTL